MSCSLYGSLSSDHLDRQLSTDEQMVLEAHIALCRSCRERHTELEELRDMLAAMGSAEPSPGLEARLDRRLDDDSGSRWGVLCRALLRLFPTPPLVPASTTAAVILMVTAGLCWPQPLAVERTASARVERHASMLTVWDSDRERIVAAVDATGMAGESIDLDALAASTTVATDARAVEVRIFLYESIVVHG